MLPVSVDAAVYFTEIAWMGSTESANHEWIELFNSGNSINVDGWKIVDSNNLSISLAGTIPENSHVVLERSSDASAPGPAFLIYTGSLVNTGATLRLERSNGSLEDQVSGGDGWQNLGGDNSTKNTPQYTSGGWVTGEPTPGGGVVKIVEDEIVETDVDNDDEEVSSEVESKQTNRNSSPVPSLTLPDVSLKLSIDSQAIGYVNQSIKFTSKAYGVGDTLIDSLKYEWNFGDGYVSTKKEPEHIFKHPGKYVVTMYAGFKRQEQVARHEITILPVALSLSKNRQGNIQINNESKYEVDLSNYYLAGHETFVFPPRTILLPNQTITLDESKIGGGQNSLVMIYDAEGAVLSMLEPVGLTDRTNQSVVDNSPTPMISAVAVSRPIPVVSSAPNSQFSFNINEEGENAAEVAPPSEIVLGENTSQKASALSANSNKNGNWPYLALIGLIILAILGAIFTAKRN